MDREAQAGKSGQERAGRKEQTGKSRRGSADEKIQKGKYNYKNTNRKEQKAKYRRKSAGRNGEQTSMYETVQEGNRGRLLVSCVWFGTAGGCRMVRLFGMQRINSPKRNPLRGKITCKK